MNFYNFDKNSNSFHALIYLSTLIISLKPYFFTYRNTIIYLWFLNPYHLKQHYNSVLDIVLWQMAKKNLVLVFFSIGIITLCPKATWGEKAFFSLSIINECEARNSGRKPGGLKKAWKKEEC